MQSKDPSIKKLADEKIASMFLSFGEKFKKSYKGNTATYVRRPWKVAAAPCETGPAKPALSSERPG